MVIKDEMYYRLKDVDEKMKSTKKKLDLKDKLEIELAPPDCPHASPLNVMHSCSHFKLHETMNAAFCFFCKRDIPGGKLSV